MNVGGESPALVVDHERGIFGGSSAERFPCEHRIEAFVQLKKTCSGQFKGVMREEFYGLIAAIEDGERGGIEQKNGSRKIAEQVAVNAARRLRSRARACGNFLL